MPFRLLSALCVLWLFSCSDLLAAAERPNFVWLISEDNSKHYLKLFDPAGAETPRIAELAKDGLIFEHAFSNAPVCSVARTTLITGCYAPRIGTQFHRRSQLVPLPDGQRMFPAYLREAGYYTTNRQKEDYNAIKTKDVWDQSSRNATWRKRAKGQPFFHMQSFGTSHEGQLHFSKQVMASQKTKTDPESVKLAPYHPDTPTFRYTYARYHDRIQAVDAQIGAVVDQLAKDGLLEDTFIFYFGDHGGVLPRSKGYAYESGLHVPLVVRVPKNFAHLVDAKRGARAKGFVSFIDFGPTLLKLAGLDDPGGMDGRPFLGEGVTMAEVNARDEVFGYADRFDEKWDLVRTFRKGRFKYTRNYQPFNFDALQNNYRYKMLAFTEWRDLYHAGKLDAVQRQFFQRRDAEALYDIESDPHETKNLAGFPKHRAKLLELREKLSTMVKSLPDLSLFPETVLYADAFRSSPVSFGQKRQAEIARLVVVADLSLADFASARAGIEKALASENPWERYWALISASSHGEAAKGLVETAKKLAANDSEILVRVRAAEFLGLLGAAKPQETILKALRESRSEVDAALILNSLVLLRDGKPGYEFEVTAADIPHKSGARGNVGRRLSYLNPGAGKNTKAQGGKKRKR